MGSKGTDIKEALRNVSDAMFSVIHCQARAGLSVLCVKGTYPAENVLSSPDSWDQDGLGWPQIQCQSPEIHFKL